jgi:tetratricopeptide (TPR) repeat protein
MGGIVFFDSLVSGSLEQISDYYYWAVQHENHFAFFAAVFGIIGGATALYRLWVGWERTRRKLFTSYLNAQENRILECKKQVADKLSAARVGVDVTSDIDVHSDIDAALRLAERGKHTEAELRLRTLQSKVDQRLEFAEKQAKIARLQIAAIHLFLGSLRAASKEPEAAIEEFKKVLNKSPQDTDAFQYLGEQHLILAESGNDNKTGHADEALSAGEKLEQATKFADIEARKAAKVHAAKIQGLAYRALGKPVLAEELLERATVLADWTGKSINS